MLPSTTTFDQKIKDTIREIKAKVQIDYTDPFIDQSITINANESNTDPAQTADSVGNPDYKYADLDDTWILDEFYLLPDDGSEQTGWWGKTYSDTNASFLTPPTLILEFVSRPIHKLKVTGDSLRGEYPVDFTITLFDSVDDVLYTENVTGNTLVKWSKDITPITQCTSMKLEITKWSHTNRVVKILEFFTSIQEVYEGDDIISINLQEEREVSNGSLPIGNISANEIEIRLNNIDRKFDAGNAQSPLYELLKANRRIRAWIGLDINGSIEWKSLGTFWSGDWEVPEGEVWAHTTGRDKLELLRKTTFSTSNVIQNTNLYDLAELVLQDAGLVQEGYWIDTELIEYEVPYAWFEPQSHRDVLRKISEACLGQTYLSRDNIVRIEGSSFIETQRATSQIEITPDDYFTKDQPVKWSEIANYIEVETAPLKPVEVIEEVYRSNETETINAGQTLTITAFYNNTPVINAIASIEGTGQIIDTTYYAWGANIKVYSDTAGEFILIVDGYPLKVLNKERVVKQDDASITDNGRLRYKFPKNHLIQKRSIADNIATKLLDSFKNPRRDISITWRGNPVLELADRFTTTDFKDVSKADFNIISQSIEYDGGLTSKISGRRSL